MGYKNTNDMISKETVLLVIDSVMNNREIDSIRNAILAIRDKVIELDAEQNEYYVRAKIRRNNSFLPKIDHYGNLLDNAEWVIFDMCEKMGTGLYGSVRYE